ncbi:MAG TPA: chromosome segregation protein SMC, partial [Planktothrix sp. UBA8407]|nr:chromosome segregation protein SMC [Planktothrix sp. UBA8407]
MYISKFQIFNYKSFKDSTLLEFKPGINVIIGQNNVGKTAFLEALELSFSDHPHKNIRKLQPQKKGKFIPINSSSSVNIALNFDKFDVYSLIEKDQIGILANDKNTLYDSGEGLILFQKWIESSDSLEIFVEDYNSDSCTIQLKDFPEILNSLVFHIIQEVKYGITKNEKFNLVTTNDELCLDFQEKQYKFGCDTQTFNSILFEYFKNKIYRFESERFHIGSCSTGTDSKLRPNARNLAEVISQLQTQGNKNIYQKFNSYINIIFPDIKSVSAKLNPKTLLTQKHDEYEVLVWSPEADEQDIKDFALPLSQCGTGVSQVLAILYVVVTASEPQVIIIDEPQSFLHPSAAKKLIEILKEFPQHQYFIATHSPQIITAANPATIVQLSYIDGETKAQIIDAKQTAQLRSLLDELGVSLSDVFGADNILWVEGQTEKKCFPLILDKLTDIKLRGTQILDVQNTGDLEGKYADLVFDIYHNLSGGNTLFPPAIGFILDEEGRPEEKKKDLQRRSKKNGNKLEFLTRKLYENYLLEPEAIAHVINQEDCSRDQPLSENEIQSWLDDNKNQFIKGTSEDA